MTDGGHDEIGALADSYNLLGGGLATIADDFAAMTAKLDRLIAGVSAASGRLGSVSDHVALGSSESRMAVEHISSAGDNVARGARAQAAGIDSAKSAVEQLATAAAQIAAGATDQTRSVAAATHAVGQLDGEIVALAGFGRSLAQSAGTASSQAAAGTLAVNQTAEALGHLRAAAANVATAMSTLENRSTEVGAIVAASITTSSSQFLHASTSFATSSASAARPRAR